MHKFNTTFIGLNPFFAVVEIPELCLPSALQDAQNNKWSEQRVHATARNNGFVGLKKK